ncbi:SEC-C metal-binding domain-containing protein [Niabella sp.]|uniref:YecA family protein n=1 Tax=Niabella sp. TaxID=1962976 RepID=UPI00262E6030|nr:SEC-C metal-binding domain-containing protein [Niabella sp.]
MDNKQETLFEKDMIELGEVFPKITLVRRKHPELWILAGELDIFDTEQQYCGSFKVRIYVPKSYPYCTVSVQETSKFIPREADWHISTEGFCCLDIDHKLVQQSKMGINITTFMLEKVYPYFANQLYKLEHKKYAGTEYQHEFHGVEQYYREDLKLAPKQAIMVLQKMLEKKIGRNDPCPCGSAKKYKHCHEERLERLAWVGKAKLEEDLSGFIKLYPDYAKVSLELK